MNIQEKIILELYSKEYMDSLTLSTIVEGRFWLYQTTAQGKQKFLEIVSRDNVWCFLLPGQLHIKGEGGGCIKIKRNHIYEISDDHKQVVLLMSRLYERTNFMFTTLHLQDDSLHIGRSKDNEIQYDNPLISFHHAILERHPAGWFLCDMGSTNGVYVNRQRIREAYIHTGDVVDVYGLKIIVGASGILLNQMKQVRVWVESSEATKKEVAPPYISISSQRIHIAPYRCFPCDMITFEVEGPPKPNQRSELPLLFILGPSITMGVSSISMAVFSFYNAVVNKQSIAQVIPTVLMAISMSLGTILWPILSKCYESKQKKKEEEHRIKTYTRYLRTIEAKIQEEVSHQQEVLGITYPLRHALSNFQDLHLLWSRKPKDDSFLVCILGEGNKRANISFTYPKEDFQLHEDTLCTLLYKVVEQNYALISVPITLDLKQKRHIGIIGEYKICEQYMIEWLYQVVYFHSYQHVKIICIGDPSLLRRYYIPYVPHIFSDDHRLRFVLYDQKDGKRIHQHLEEIKGKQEPTIPYYVIFCFVENSSIMSLLREDVKDMEQLIVIHYAHQKVALPAYCEEILQVDGKNCSLVSENGARANFQLRAPKDIANDFLHLANMRVLEEAAIKFPDELSFLDLFHCGNIQQLHILRRWEKSDVIHSLEVAIGIHETGEPLLLDAHENYHGPHGLLAGMTGSGKSETILTYILSLAINYSPLDVSFLLIDYKGGAMAKAFEKLPHVAGIITNLDQGSMQRSLAAIQSEVTRRQKVFAHTSILYDKSNIDIDKYRSLCLEHKELQPISHLFIIADEFAELKSLQPQFLDCLKQSARIGRSLGIHVVLATQKPSGVVDDQIWSNSRFHICLRVQDRSDSQDMLKREEAAFIRRTGLFYFQVGNNEEFKKGLAAWSQAPYEPKEFYTKRQNEEITIIDSTGLPIRSRGTKSKGNSATITQLDAIVSYLSELASLQQIHVDPIWKKELEEHLAIRDIEHTYGKQIGLIGVVDDVYHQVQFPMCIPLASFQHTVLYGHSYSGKEQFLETLLVSWMKVYDPANLAIVFIDLEDMKFKKFQSMGVISEIIVADENEKVESMFIQVLTEMKRRKEGLQERAQRIVIMLHNFERFHELYEERDGDIQYILREGEKYGIVMLLTLNNVNSLPYRLSQYIQKVIMLQVKDKNDYRLCYMQHNGLYPIQKKGSGIFEENEIYLFQTGVYEEDEIQTILQQKQVCNPFTIPVLPTRVSHPIDATCDKLFIGLDITSKKKVYVDWQYRFLYIIANYSLCWTYIDIAIHQLQVMSTLCVLYCKDVMCDQDIEEVLGYGVQQHKKVVFIWYQIQHVSKDLSTSLFTRLMEDETITHILIDTMCEVSTYSVYAWFSNSLIEGSMLWMGNGFLDQQYTLKKAASHLQNRLQKNRAYFWEEDQCREIQLWEEEENG